MINLILINNFIILPANIHNYFKNANLRTFYGLFTDFLRSYYVVVILYLTITHIFASGVVRGGRCPAAGCRRPKDGAGQRPGGAWLEFLCLALCVGLEGGKRSSTKAQPQGGEGSDGMIGVFGFGSLRWIEGREEDKAKSPIIEGQPATKIPEIPKIPVALNDTGELKQLP